MDTRSQRWPLVRFSFNNIVFSGKVIKILCLLASINWAPHLHLSLLLACNALPVRILSTNKPLIIHAKYV